MLVSKFAININHHEQGTEQFVKQHEKNITIFFKKGHPLDAQTPIWITGYFQVWDIRMNKLLQHYQGMKNWNQNLTVTCSWSKRLGIGRFMSINLITASCRILSCHLLKQFFSYLNAWSVYCKHNNYCDNFWK